MRLIILFFTLIIFSGCSSVTIRTDNQAKSYEPSSYQQNVTYWWWGLYGEHYINVREACQGKTVKQMQSYFSFTDSLSSIFTLGIYLPKTARIWCNSATNIKQELKHVSSL
jgi:hypothetical protein